jgi:hypothetical protein
MLDVAQFDTLQYIDKDQGYVVLLRHIPGLPGSYFRRQKLGKLRDTARLTVTHDLLQTAFPELLPGLVFRLTDAICVEKKPVTDQEREVADRIASV